jgi:hypothetical protein
MYEMFWITPGCSSNFEVHLLMEEFQKNLEAFVLPTRIYHTVEPQLLCTPLYQLSRVEQLQLWIELMVASYFDATDSNGTIPYRYHGIDVSTYVCLIQPYEAGPGMSTRMFYGKIYRPDVLLRPHLSRGRILLSSLVKIRLHGRTPASASQRPHGHGISARTHSFPPLPSPLLSARTRKNKNIFFNFF